MGRRSVDTRDVEIAKRIRALRLERGLTQVELGNFLGVTFQQFQKYERGVNRVSAGRLQRIASVLDVPVTFFFTGAHEQETQNGSSPDSEFDFFQRGDTLQMARAYSRIKERSIRRTLLKLAEGIARN